MKGIILFIIIVVLALVFMDNDSYYVEEPTRSEYHSTGGHGYDH